VRVINLAGRLHIEQDSGALDVHVASGGRFDADPQAIYERWDEFVGWAADLAPRPGRRLTKIEPAALGSPVPRPRQVFAVGLNYTQHADESGFARPDAPIIFTKFASSISGPNTTVVLPDGSVDWEVELVVVIGRGGRQIGTDDAWSHVAGVCVGQDLSERRRQHAGPAPQFALAKSHAGFSPIGPTLVTIDEFADVNDLEVSAEIDGEIVQHGRTSQLIFPVSELITRLSEVVELYPGDVIFTGTPSGVGAGRTPPRFLRPGNVLRSRIEGIGELTQRFVAADDSSANGRSQPSEPTVV
jgi:2-keto-4-pentenoate hydratase/2-oxohepta-3-ene-1,7-dioic acid hydratase in catechol pathway